MSTGPIGGDGVRNPILDLWEQWASSIPSHTSAGPRVLAQQMELFGAALAALNEATSQPLEDFLQAQRQFAQILDSWADAQAAAADQMKSLAQQQRVVVEAFDSWAAPLRRPGAGEAESD